MSDESEFKVVDKRGDGVDKKDDTNPNFQLIENDKKGEGEKAREAITFSTFIFSLATSALVYLGEIEEPESKKFILNLDLAKQNIDIIGMLGEKTKENLDKDEEKLLGAILYDLRLKYLAKVNAK